MMRLFPRQRLRLALFICPTLQAFNGPEAARALDLPCDWLQFGVPAFGFFDANIAKQSVVNRSNNGTDFADHIIEKHSGANLPFSGGGSAPVNANTQPGQVLPALRGLCRRAKALHDMVADCWIGDFIGGLALFFLLFAGLFVGCGLGL